MDVLKDLETKTEQELHNITISTYQNVIDLSPLLKELSINAKNYLKSLQNVRQAAFTFFDSLSKVSQMATQSKGTASTLGDVISDLVTVKRDIETRHLDVLKYLENDLITPLEKLVESDVLYVKSFQKNYNQENKTKSELVEKAKGELLKVRKKSQRKKPTEKYEEKEKQCEEQVNSYKKELQEFRLISCRKAMAEERKRYCFILDRCSIVSKSTMEFSEHNAQILREKLPVWFSHIKKKGDPDSQVNGSILHAQTDKTERMKLRANFAHSAVEMSQLSFKVGDLIHPISEVVSGWQYGENLKTNRSGWFPAAYTEQVLAVTTGPTVSHTLPAGGLHPRPPLETSAGHKSLKRFSSAGPDAMHLPPPDYPGDLENKPGANHLLSVDTRGQSGNQVTTTASHSSGLNGNNSTSQTNWSPVIPPPPPPPLPPPIILLEESKGNNTQNPGTDTESNDVVTNSSPDVSHL